MSILSELTTIITAITLPVEAGVFSDKASDEYVVLLPLSDIFELHADNLPGFDVQEVRILLFSKGNYLKRTARNAVLNNREGFKQMVAGALAG